MNWHEDFGDEPSVEERTPHGLSPNEIIAIIADESRVKCDECGERFHADDVVITDMYEYCTMDIDPESVICLDCYEACRDAHIPDDPTLFDGCTPLQLV